MSDAKTLTVKWNGTRAVCSGENLSASDLGSVVHGRNVIPGTQIACVESPKYAALSINACGTGLAFITEMDRR